MKKFFKKLGEGEDYSHVFIGLKTHDGRLKIILNITKRLTIVIFRDKKNDNSR